eukprot:837121-Pyramimonas_sp.AAC.1
MPTSPLADLDDPSTEITGSSTARAIMKLPNFKAAPTLKWGDPNSIDHGDRGPHSDGAVAELWKLWLERVAGPLAQIFQACHQTKQ